MNTRNQTNWMVLGFLTVVLVAAAACTATPAGSGTTPAAETDGGSTPRGGDAVAPISNDCTGIGKAAAPTAACCLVYGIDACGAGLVCAALDGRTQPVCYLEKSRTSGQSCSDDKLCGSGECLTPSRTCKFGLSEVCATTADCRGRDGDKSVWCGNWHSKGSGASSGAALCKTGTLATSSDSQASRNYEACRVDSDCTGVLTKCSGPLTSSNVGFCY